MGSRYLIAVPTTVLLLFQPAYPPVTGRASTTGTYSDFKRFQTGAKISLPQ